MHLNYIYIQTNNKQTNKQSDGYTVILDESKIGKRGRRCINDCSQIWNNFTLQQIHKFVLQMNFPYTITKWYKHMEIYHTYPNMTPVHNLKLWGKYLHVYLCLIFWAITQQPCRFSDMNGEKIFSLILCWMWQVILTSGLYWLWWSSYGSVPNTVPFSSALTPTVLSGLKKN